MALIYLDDHRYPGPAAHPPPGFITGLPTQAELDAFPRMFTWGELKGIVRSNKLELLMRNRAMQARYDKWSSSMKVKYGSTGKSAGLNRAEGSSRHTSIRQGADDLAEKYLTEARLPWKGPKTPEHVYPGATAGQHVPQVPPAAPAEALGRGGLAGQAGSSAPASQPDSGVSTPASAGFVSLASLQGKLKRLAGKSGKSPTRGDRPGSPLVNGRAAGAAHGRPNNDGDGDGDEDEDEDESESVYLKYDPAVGLDTDKYAVLPNDWPYCIPYGVKHYCVWSRVGHSCQVALTRQVPIAHPCLVEYDPAAWAEIEENGLCGFTGVTPIVLPESISRAGSVASSPRTKHAHDQPRIPSPDGATLPSPTLPAAPGAKLAGGRGKTPSPPTTVPPHLLNDRPPPSPLEEELDPIFLLQSKAHGRQAEMGYKQHEWYPADVRFGGSEMRRWAGVEYESPGGREVGKMVKGLWDERGWECIWFVNPPSVPGFSHFHVFARRKTPEEIDAAEHLLGAESASTRA